MILHMHDFMLLVFYHFSKLEMFVTCKKNNTTQQTPQLLFAHVWLYFGPTHIISSDRNSYFLSTFCKKLWHLLGCQLRFSINIHP